MIQILRTEVESRKLRLCPNDDAPPIPLYGDTREEAWAHALDLCDKFQNAPRMSREVARLFRDEKYETKLTLVNVNYCPMFVQLPAKRVGQDGKVKLSWEEIRALGGIPDNGCIKLG
jgi:hypothetical protein